MSRYWADEDIERIADYMKTAAMGTADMNRDEAWSHIAKQVVQRMRPLGWSPEVRRSAARARVAADVKLGADTPSWILELAGDL